MWSMTSSGRSKSRSETGRDDQRKTNDENTEHPLSNNYQAQSRRFTIGLRVVCRISSMQPVSSNLGIYAQLLYLLKIPTPR